MTKSEFEDLLLRYSRGECTKDEDLKIQVWFKRIKMKPHFALSIKERSLLEAKMLTDIDQKIDNKKHPIFEKGLFAGLFGIYIIYGGIAASLVTAAFFNKNHKTTEMLIKEERAVASNKPAKMSFVYNDTPLSIIAYELSNCYGMQIILSNDKIKSCPFTGDLSNMTLMQKFDTVCESVGANYQVLGSNIILSGQGCR